MPEYLSVDQVAERLNISKALVYKLISGEELPCFRFGRLVRVKVSDLTDYINRQSGKSPGPE